MRLLTQIKFIGICIIVLLYIGNVYSQISEGGTPPSFYKSALSFAVDTRELLKPNMATIQQEDVANEQKGIPYRFAVDVKADLNTNNSGAWETFENGDKLWRMKIKVQDALALGLYFNDFWLPEGTELYIYSDDKQQVIGAFTHSNNSASGLFATELIKGDIAVLEYFQPSYVSQQAIINISEVSYAYRGVSFTSKSGSCEVDVICSPEGDHWQIEKRGVVRIDIKIGSSHYWCTGSLVNNVRQDRTPYILTADHCGSGATTANINQWIFYFNYETATCSGSFSPNTVSITGASFKAHGGDQGELGSDFYLVQINSSVSPSINPYFIGWDRSNIPSDSGVSIHHPDGDFKKISTYRTHLVSSSYGGIVPNTHWRVQWDPTVNGHGVTEGGSSGSPIFDYTGHIVGTLTGGYSSCSSPYAYDDYGKFSYHWQSNGTGDTLQLKRWLDPDNTGTLVLGGLYVGMQDNNSNDNSDILIYPNPSCDFVYVQTSSRSNLLVEVYTLLGEKVITKIIDPTLSNLTGIDLSEFPSGMYFVNIKDKHQVYSRKISIIK